MDCNINEVIPLIHHIGKALLWPDGAQKTSPISCIQKRHIVQYAGCSITRICNTSSATLD